MNKKEKDRQQAKIEYLYSRQNFAFDMGTDKCFKGSDEVHMKPIIENLAAYEEDTQTYGRISIDDVFDYLSSEYNENGELAVLHMPENIEAYIDWFWSGGSQICIDYDMWLYNYQRDHLDKYGDGSVFDMSEETLYELIDDFKNCPDKEKYKYK